MTQCSIRLPKQKRSLTITPLTHISLMLQYYFFFTSINYNEEKASHSKKKINKVQKRCD